MAKGDRQRRRGKCRNNKRKQPPVSTKVSISQLVSEGLLIPGHTIVCNAWPFTSVVSKHGTFDACWKPIPEDFYMPANANSIMKRYFETPSAWATAVCRLMRAQQQNDRTNNEATRVAVNGWTACRVRIPKDDPNRALAERLLIQDMETRSDHCKRNKSSALSTNAASAADSNFGDMVEVPLDLLRRELLDKETRQPQPVDKRNCKAKPGSSEKEETKPGKHVTFQSAETLEISGSAVDGLAKRVESDLALGSSNSADVKPDDLRDRKRKGGSDTSRHKKLSRVPSDDTMSDVVSMEDAYEVTDETQRCLDAFQKAANALGASPGDLKALRYQRKRQLRNSLASSVYTWLQQRQRQREKHRLANSSGCKGSTEEALPASAEVRIPWSLETTQQNLRLWCAACGSSGKEYLKCYACGDHYHPFCTSIPPFLENGPFLCASCRLCVSCLEGEDEGSVADLTRPLLHCDDCGLCTHIKCTSQGSDHNDGLRGQIAETGRWLCDSCIRCLECGLTVSTAPPGTIWTNDFTMCQPCAQQIEKSKVCPECLATYSSCQAAPNMVCCDICAFWIHVKCDSRLTPDVYDALITLEDAPYVCMSCNKYDDLTSSARMLSVYSSDSDDSNGLEPIAGLPRCLKTLTLRTVRDWSATSLVACLPPLLTNDRIMKEDAASAVVESEAEAEAANLLLSLTRSDVRFEQERFNVERSELQLCQPFLSYSIDGQCRQTAESDWRECVLCGLHGDGMERQKISLGRLAPITGGRWVHVECLAWAWGPNTVDRESSQAVRFEGESVAMICTLCGRVGASICCCAPVSCPETAYHLPCLLLAGSLSLAENSKEEPASPWYCLQWRRALCVQHAPEFSATLASKDAAETTRSFGNVRVDACVNQLDNWSHLATRIGNLVVVSGDLGLSADQKFSCLRYFELGGLLHTLGVEARQDEDKSSGGSVWQGWLLPGLHVEKEDEDVQVLASTTLSLLLSMLFEARKQQIKIKRWPARSEFLMDVAATKPFRFLGLPSTLYQESMNTSPCIPQPANK